MVSKKVINKDLRGNKAMENDRRFKMLSLFDGSGSFPLAAYLCGIEPVAASEIEPFPIKVTRARFPNMKHYGDISEMNGADLEPVDLVTGGSPCQDISVAGKRQGMSKKCPKCDFLITGNESIEECPKCGVKLKYIRSGLFMEQIRIIKELRKADEFRKLQSGRTNEHIRPRFMLWENVTGAFSSNKGEDFRAVLEETARIVDKTASIPRPDKGKWKSAGCIVGDGYSVAWRVLDAQYWGVPQRRRRIALVADFGGRCAGEILLEREGLSRNFTESKKAWQSIAGSVEDCIGTTGIPYDMTHANDVIREYKVYSIGAYNSEGMKSDNPNSGIYEADTSRTLDLNGGNPACNQGGIAIVEHKAYGIDRAAFNQGANAKYDFSIIEEQQPTMTARGPWAVAQATFNLVSFGEYKEEDKASCIKSRDYKDSTDLVVEPDYIVRRLTPLECCRLQGLPDWWTDGISIENPTEEDLEFWREVFETHRKIVSGAKKPKTDKKIIKWLKEPDNDSAKYKMYGNGIALPCFLYVMEGIKEVLEKSAKE